MRLPGPRPWNKRATQTSREVQSKSEPELNISIPNENRRIKLSIFLDCRQHVVISGYFARDGYGYLLLGHGARDPIRLYVRAKTNQGQYWFLSYGYNRQTEATINRTSSRWCISIRGRKWIISLQIDAATCSSAIERESQSARTASRPAFIILYRKKLTYNLLNFLHPNSRRNRNVSRLVKQARWYVKGCANTYLSVEHFQSFRFSFPVLHRGTRFLHLNTDIFCNYTRRINLLTEALRRRDKILEIKIHFVLQFSYFFFISVSLSAIYCIGMLL